MLCGLKETYKRESVKYVLKMVSGMYSTRR